MIESKREVITLKDPVVEKLYSEMPARLYVSEMDGRISGGSVRNYEGVGDRLRNLRERMGIPQREIAKTTGTTQSCVSRLEDFTQTPGISLRTLVKHLRALGYELDLTFRQVEKIGNE
jgi:predicted transcriptional regulator